MQSKKDIVETNDTDTWSSEVFPSSSRNHEEHS